MRDRGRNAFVNNNPGTAWPETMLRCVRGGALWGGTFRTEVRHMDALCSDACARCGR